MTDQFLPANKKYKKQVILTIIIALPVAVASFYLHTNYMHTMSSELSRTDFIEKLKVINFWILIMNAIISIGVSAYLLSLATKIIKYEMYPPPGMRLIKRTKISTGKQAKLIGALFIFSALITLSTNALLIHRYSAL